MVYNTGLYPIATIDTGSFAVALTESQLLEFRANGHLTVPEVFSEAQMQAAIADGQSWGERCVEAMDAQQRAWYLERRSEDPLLRKLDNPVFHRPLFRRLAQDEMLLGMVQQLIGRGVQVFFSQLFFKPPQAGGPKPVHQDNFYFGPDREDALLTAWIALDEATVDNGCLYYGQGSQLAGKLAHVAPPDEPFNLFIPSEVASRCKMTPAPVPCGGVSFHHGLTLHQSSSNTSRNWRRAVAIHYLQNNARLVTPQLPYDDAVIVPMSEAV